MKKLNNILDIVSTYNNVGGTKHHDISLSLYIHQTYLGWTKKKNIWDKSSNPQTFHNYASYVPHTMATTVRLTLY